VQHDVVAVVLDPVELRVRDEVDALALAHGEARDVAREEEHERRATPRTLAAFGHLALSADPELLPLPELAVVRVEALPRAAG